MKNIKTVKITHSDVNISEAGLGYHTYQSGDGSKTVIAVIVRGTNGTIEEWTSNFDIGDYSTIGETDWENPLNHKGFDIASNVLMDIIDNYIEENRNNPDFNENNLAYWITGHSRGAAIANIVGACYEGEGKTAYTNTYASPNTTLDSNARNYRSIFNIVNTDDFVPCLPTEAWSYTRYGRNGKESIADKYETQWEKFIGIWDYDPDSYGMDDTVNSIGSILDAGADPRVESYKYTCDDHGDGSKDNITATNYGTSKKSREEAMPRFRQTHCLTASSPDMTVS